MKWKVMMVPLFFSLVSFSMEKGTEEDFFHSAPHWSEYKKNIERAIIKDNQEAIGILFNQPDSLLNIHLLLAQRKLNPNNQGAKKGHTILHWAVRQDKPTIVNILLIDPITNPNVKNCNDNTALHFAVIQGNEKAVGFLLLHDDTDPNIKTNNGYAPLHLCLMQEKNPNNRILSLLLHSLKIDPNIADGDGNTPLHYAVGLGNIEGVKLLLTQSPINRALKNLAGKSAIDYAYHARNQSTNTELFDAIIYLLENLY